MPQLQSQPSAHPLRRERTGPFARTGRRGHRPRFAGSGASVYCGRRGVELKIVTGAQPFDLTPETLARTRLLPDRASQKTLQCRGLKAFPVNCEEFPVPSGKSPLSLKNSLLLRAGNGALNP